MQINRKRLAQPIVFLVFLLFACIHFPSHAQKKQSKRVLKSISGPEVVAPIKVVEEEPEEFLDEEAIAVEVSRNLAASIEQFLKSLPIMAAQEEEKWESQAPVYVQITEQLQIDCVWVTTHEYFGIWDSQKLNPYAMDVTKLTDTLSLRLYNPAREEHWAMPIEVKRISSLFGFRRFRWHYGIDLPLTVGDSVVSAFDGIVRITQYERLGYGNYIVVRHKNGLETLYGHLSKTLVKVGDEVKAGQLIGRGGNTGRSTGPHLHFEVRYMGNPIDPEEFFDFENKEIKMDVFHMHAGVFDYLSEAKKITYHRVRSGDTLSGISKKYGVSVSKLMALNGLRQNSVLRIGQNLRVN